jgi:hypothetical protein
MEPPIYPFHGQVCGALYCHLNFHIWSPLYSHYNCQVCGTYVAVIMVRYVAITMVRFVVPFIPIIMVIYMPP